MRIAQEEIFGPTTALIRATRLDEAIRIANGVKFGLSSSIFTRDVNKAFRAMRDLNTGITYVNAGTTGAEVHLPFGGTKADRQRPPRGGPGRARLLHRVEVDLRRLLGQAPARADRRARVGPRSRPEPEARRLRPARGARHRSATRSSPRAPAGSATTSAARGTPQGTGTFMGGEGTEPSDRRAREGGARRRASARDRLSRTSATPTSSQRFGRRIPYEEPAFDVYPL